MLDVVKFMPVGGPIRSWWTAPIERAMVGLKKALPDGGLSQLKTLTETVFTEEISILKKTYDATHSNCFDSPNEYRNTSSLYNCSLS